MDNSEETAESTSLRMMTSNNLLIRVILCRLDAFISAHGTISHRGKEGFADRFVGWNLGAFGKLGQIENLSSTRNTGSDIRGGDEIGGGKTTT